MRKWVQIVLAVLLLAVAGVIAWHVLREREPVYQGKPLSVWLTGYDSPKNQAAWQQTDEAIRQIGPRAIPTLLQMLRLSDSAPWKRTLLDWAYKQHFIKIHHIKAWGQNWRAANALGAMGLDAAGAVPELIHLYENPISGPSQRYTLMALGKIGPAAKMAIPSLLSTVNTSTDEEVRASTVFALGGIHTEPERVVPVLIRCLADTSIDVQSEAATGLGNFGENAKLAVPALVVLLQNPNQEVMNHARAALLRIDPEAAAKAAVK
jgi:HEAT repeat protein